jgi:hypothetical protein
LDLLICIKLRKLFLKEIGVSLFDQKKKVGGKQAKRSALHLGPPAGRETIPPPLAEAKEFRQNDHAGPG